MDGIVLWFLGSHFNDLSYVAEAELITLVSQIIIGEI